MQVNKRRQEMKPVLQVTGKAKQVFKYMDLLNRHRGNITLKELSKNNKNIKLDLRS